MPTHKIIFIDNYDSFTYNVVQALQMLEVEVRIVRNDQVSCQEILALNPTHIILGPGPGAPASAGISLACVHLGLPVLGVCLGHQVIAKAYGGRVVRAPQPMHGKTSKIYHDGMGIFRGVPQGFVATRYHSLLVEEASLPAELEVSARTSNGEVMGIRHVRHRVEGVQFHPESILSECGQVLFSNFIDKNEVEAVYTRDSY